MTSSQTPTPQVSLEDQIKKLYSRGLSRRNIANLLGITEWKVRTVVRSIVTQTVQSRKSSQKGLGALTLAPIKMTQTTAVKKAVILSDIHIPYHDTIALGIAVEYMLDYNPDTIVLNGDIIDFYNCSSYRKDPTRIHTLQDELNETKDFLKLIRSRHPSSVIFYTIGNHEDRMQRYILDKAHEFGTLSCLALDELLGFKDLDIICVDEKHEVSLGALEVFHGTIVRKDSGASAKAHHTKTGGSLLIGHTHRMGQFYKTNKWGTHVCVENGFLGRLDFDYASRPDWQQGFSTVEYADDGRFSVRQHFIDNHCLIADGKVYTGA